jgi:hypothetical protein
MGILAHGLIAGDPHPKKLEFLDEVQQALFYSRSRTDLTAVATVATIFLHD